MSDFADAVNQGAQTPEKTLRAAEFADLRKHLENHCSPQELDRLYANVRAHLVGASLTLCFPHRFFAGWFTTSLEPRFALALHDCGLHATYKNTSGISPTTQTGMPPAPRRVLPFGAEFQFSRFLVNSRNAFPLASAQEVANSLQTRYNPFVLCGESGSGKTFLLRAIANAKREQGVQNMHVSSIEELHNLYTSRHDARTMLLSMDVFALDDIQDLGNHPALQNELVSLFDAFHIQQKQMIFTCAEKLAQLDFLQPKLKSRLEWGLMVTLKTPDLDIRSRYAMTRCQERGIELPKERLLLLAQRFADLRHLEGSLLKIWAYQDLVHQEISDADFENILSYLDERAAPKISVDHVMNIVCQELDITREAMLSQTRKQDVVFARQVCMYLCRCLIGLSFPELGKFFGGRDHSTVLYSYRKIAELQKDDKKIKSMLHELSERCSASPEGSSR